MCVISKQLLIFVTMRKTLTIIICMCCLAAFALADLLMGDVHVDLFHPDAMGRTLLLDFRLPRVVTAILAGAGLSLSGLQMQSVFRNPLADPHIMGVSAGAGFGAALVSMAIPATGVAALSTHLGTSFAAMIGAAVSSLVIILISRRFSDSSTMLVFGVLLGYIFSAASSVISYFASARDLKAFYSWSAGSFSANPWSAVALLAVILVIAIALAVINLHALDVLLFGDEFARLGGLDVKRSRIISIVSCCVFTGTATALCGPLGFVGIISPHIARTLTGSSVHRNIILPVMLVGSAICLAADVISLSWSIPLPVGSTMSLIGIPVVLYILLKSRNA